MENMTTMGKVDTSDLMTIIRWIIYIYKYTCSLPWIFPGAPWRFNGAPGNIQGDLDRYAHVKDTHIKGCRVRYLYSTVIFLQHAVNRHPIIACPWGRGAIPFVIFMLGVISWSTLCCMHKAVLNYIIKARNCICTWFESNFYNGMRNV